MADALNKSNKVKLSLGDKTKLLVPYVKRKILEQVEAVALIVIYLVLFQTLVLGIPIAEAGLIGLGIAVIVLGLAFFMEGLFLGLMPLGEVIGIRMPQKSKLLGILVFSFVLGVGVTYAEPAIGVLQLAGAFIKPWDAPLLFAMLNKHAEVLKIMVGVGVGVAVILGMIRFMFQLSLKPYLYIGVPIISIASLVAFFEPNLRSVLSVAWDAGAVTTGPVTVPLVLALGIGITRVVSKGDSEGGGFGVVTLASLLPIYTVLILGVALLPGMPAPSTQAAFYAKENQKSLDLVFRDRNHLVGYALQNASVEAQESLFESPEAYRAFLASLKNDGDLRQSIFGSADLSVMERWAVKNGSPEQRLAIFGSEEAIRATVLKYANAPPPPLDVGSLLQRNGISALQAILPLSIFLIAVLTLLLREKVPRGDEIAIGLFFAVFGMFLFNIGIELGLGKLGNQVGSKVPASFKRIELVEQTQTIRNFDEDYVQTSISPDGKVVRFFYANMNNGYLPIEFDRAAFDEKSGTYTYVPSRGPIFGSEQNPAGFILVLVFGFVMGYGATLAEPALNALGVTVEALTVGAFKKALLMQTVAIGVGVGILVGLVKIVFDVPLLFLIGPPYILLMFLTLISSEEFVNIGWDSAGVTTGPITVPLVLAIGLGLSSQVGAVEGFGILASASAYPILAVLVVGLIVSSRKKDLAKQSAS